jgi:tetratricopeptide (TPR) repeat protein
LAIMEGRLGRDHPDLATPLNNLALLYYLQKSYGKAQRLLERSLRIARRTPDHPALASVLHNLGVVYQTRKRYAKAARTLERALAVREKTLGRAHPEVANSLNNLGALYRKRGQFVKAEHSLKRALAITEKAFNPDHPFVAASLGSLASLYEATHRYGKAQALFARALAIREKAFDPDHPDIAASRDSLARVSRMRERDADARRRHRAAEAKGRSYPAAHHRRLQGRYAQGRAAHTFSPVRLGESGRRTAVASARAHRHARACYGKPGLSARPLARSATQTRGPDGAPPCCRKAGYRGIGFARARPRRGLQCPQAGCGAHCRSRSLGFRGEYPVPVGAGRVLLEPRNASRIGVDQAVELEVFDMAAALLHHLHGRRPVLLMIADAQVRPGVLQFPERRRALGLRPPDNGKDDLRLGLSLDPDGIDLEKRKFIRNRGRRP